VPLPSTGRTRRTAYDETGGAGLHALTALGYAAASRQGRSAGRRRAALALSFTSRVLIGSVAAPVFVLDQTQDGGSASAGG